MNKPVRIVLVGEAQEAFNKLNVIAGEQLTQGKTNSEEIQLIKSIRQKIELIKQNPFYGDNIPKNRIPKQFNVTNLWRAELTNYWRMLYVIRGDSIEIVCFICQNTTRVFTSGILSMLKNHKTTTSLAFHATSIFTGGF